MHQENPGQPGQHDEGGMGALIGRLAELRAEVADVRRRIAALDDRTAAGELVIERLDATIEWLRSGGSPLIRPVLTDLQRLRDDLLRQASVASGETAALLEAFAYSVEQMLARAGIEVLRPEIGSPFDARRHRLAGVVASSRPELDGTVAEVISDGYVDVATNRIVTSATVRVYRPTPTPSDQE